MVKLAGAASIVAMLALLLVPVKSVWVGQFEQAIAINSVTSIAPSGHPMDGTIRSHGHPMDGTGRSHRDGRW